jgi:hypothetical protein
LTQVASLPSGPFVFFFRFLFVMIRLSNEFFFFLSFFLSKAMGEKNGIDGHYANTSGSNCYFFKV